jgi:hypothetical protein
MSNQNDSSSVFYLLREYDVELSPQVQLMLQKFKFNSVRKISMIDLEKLDVFENDVRTLFELDEKHSNMSQEQKIALFGEYFANKPKQFQLLAGEKFSIYAAVGLFKKLVQSYEKTYLFEKLKNVAELNKQKKKIQRQHNNAMDTIVANVNQANSTEENGQVRRKGKTLKQYIEQWFLSTKLKLTVTSADVEIIDGKIKCTKCTASRPFKISLDSCGGWKISSYMTHLRSAHQKPEQRPIDATETMTGRPSGNSDNAVEEAQEEPQPKRQRVDNQQGFPPSASTSSQLTST